MPKKYMVRLSAKGCRTLREIAKKLNGSSQKLRRAQMLLKADVAGPVWTDERIAATFDSRTRTVEKLRERFVTEGFEQTLHGKPRAKPPTEKILSGKQEARVIAMRLRIKRFQLVACVFDFELPIDSALPLVAGRMPSLVFDWSNFKSPRRRPFRH